MNNNKIHIDSEIIKLLYFKYKAYGLPLVGLFVSWLIFFQFVIPQVQNVLTVKDQVATSEETLAVLTQNYNTISSMKDDDLTSSLAIASRALPPVKDFAGILDAISTAAGASGVSVNDYSFQPGNISTVGESLGTAQTIQLTLTINANIDKTKQFLTQLSNQLPLSEVVSVSILQLGTAQVTTNFFFSPPTNPSFVETSPLPVITSSQKQLLQQLLGMEAQTLQSSASAAAH